MVKNNHISNDIKKSDIILISDLMKALKKPNVNIGDFCYIFNKCIIPAKWFLIHPSYSEISEIIFLATKACAHCFKLRIISPPKIKEITLMNALDQTTYNICLNCIGECRQISIATAHNIITKYLELPIAYHNEYCNELIKMNLPIYNEALVKCDRESEICLRGIAVNIIDSFYIMKKFNHV